MKIITRKEAIRHNNPKYFTGEPCKNGHIAYRYTVSGACFGCLKQQRVTIARDLRPQLAEVTTRKVAQERGLNKYFTGKPCKNGHIAYRYTDSGTCYDCINRDRIAPDSPVALARDSQFAELATQIATKSRFLDELVELNLIVHPTDVATVKAIVLGFAIGRRDNISINDVWLTARPKAGVRYHVKCHHEDVALIKAATEAMYQAHRPDIEAIRNDIIGKVEREVTAEVDYDIKETFK